MQELAAGARVAVLTSGGDAPGMNAAVRAVVQVGALLGIETLGVRRGYQGLIDDDLTPLEPRHVDGIHRRGGTLLGTTRCLAFHDPTVRARAAEHLRARAVQGLIVIGGNGSLAGARALQSELDHTGNPFRIIGIPASIDNDLGYTTLAIGTDTALNTIVEAIDRISDTASSHGRTFIVEVMGRDCGYLALTAAVATESDGVLLRESQVTPGEAITKVVDIVRGAYAPDRGKHRVIIVKSEGVEIGSSALKSELDAALNAAGLPVETRVSVLGHMVRGGAPSAFDRLLAGRLGHAAMRAVIRGRTGEMTGWHVLLRPGDPPPVVFDLDPFITFWPLEQVLAETERIKDGSSAVTQWRVRILREVEPILAR